MTKNSITNEKHLFLFSTDSRILTFCIMTPENPEKPSESSENKRLREKFVKEISQYGFQYAEMTDPGLKNTKNFYLFLNASFENVSFCADHFAPDFIFGVRKNLTSDFTVAYYKRNRIGKYCKADSGGIIFEEFFENPRFVYQLLEGFEKHMAETLVEKEKGYNRLLYETVFEQKKFTGQHILAARHFHLFETKEHRERMEKENAYMQTEEYKEKQREFDEKLKALREKNRKFEESRRREAMEKRKYKTAPKSKKEE
jgi:hypothetical protein